MAFLKSTTNLLLFCSSPHQDLKYGKRHHQNLKFMIHLHFQKLHLPVQTEVSVCSVLSLFIYTKIMMVLVAQHYQECAFFRHQ